MTETKNIASSFTAEIKAADNGNGGYDITMSVPTVDRDGEIIDPKAFDPLPDWLNIDIDHGMSVLTTVGSGTPAYEGDTLKLLDFTFASTSLGQDVKTLVDEKHVRKMSVAFMSAVREVDQKDGKPHVRKAELLNAAIVAIPSNREADIVLAGKQFAALTGARSGPGASVKAVSGSYEDRADRLRQALRAVHAEAQWLWIRATFDDSVVFEIEDILGNVATYQAGYTADGDSFTFGDPTEVDLAEVIVPPVKGADPGDTKSPDTAPEEAAAPAAAHPPALGARAKATAALADAALLLNT